MIHDNSPFISIIIPALNEEKNISLCLDGISQLNYPKEKIEIIVVDNGSTDCTVTVAQKHGANVFNAPGVTIAALRNHGWRKSKGEYVSFLDADCIPSKQWLSLSMDSFELFSDVIAVSGVMVLHVNTSSPTPWVEQLWIDYLRSKYSEKFTFSNSLASFCFVVPRVHMEALGGFNEELTTCEDSDLGYRLAQVGKILINTSIEIVHLGNAKTLRGFFKRQLWQGSSNWKNLRSHKFTINEIPSIGIPFIFVITLFLFLFLLGIGFYLYAFLLLAILFCFLLSVTFAKKTGHGLILSSKYFAIWFTYLLARGLALFVPFIVCIKNVFSTKEGI